MSAEVSQVLSNEDGPLIMVRAASPAEALALAAEEAADNDLIVTDGERDIRIGWIRATPCRAGGHETRDGFDWCEGNMRCHYGYSRSGPGAFQGTFVNARHRTDEDAALTPEDRRLYREEGQS